jgi:hypothetical protein
VPIISPITVNYQQHFNSDEYDILTHSL